MSNEAAREQAIQAWLRLYGGVDIDVAADVGAFFDEWIGPAIRTERRMVVEQVRERIMPLERLSVVKRGEPLDQPRCLVCRVIVRAGQHGGGCPVPDILDEIGSAR